MLIFEGEAPRGQDFYYRPITASINIFNTLWQYFRRNPSCGYPASVSSPPYSASWALEFSFHALHTVPFQKQNRLSFQIFSSSLFHFQFPGNPASCASKESYAKCNSIFRISPFQYHMHVILQCIFSLAIAGMLYGIMFKNHCDFCRLNIFHIHRVPKLLLLQFWRGHKHYRCWASPERLLFSCCDHRKNL